MVYRLERRQERYAEYRPSRQLFENDVRLGSKRPISRRRVANRGFPKFLQPNKDATLYDRRSSHPLKAAPLYVRAALGACERGMPAIAMFFYRACDAACFVWLQLLSAWRLNRVAGACDFDAVAVWRVCIPAFESGG